MRSLAILLLVTVVALAVFMSALAAPASAQGQGDLSATDVEEAIEKAIDYIYRQQRPSNGSFGLHAGGYDQTPLFALALLEAGVDPQERRLQRAINHVRGQTYDRTYTLSLQIMVLCAAEPQVDLNLIRSCADRLASWQIAQGQDNGLWAYPGGAADYSNTQFALLALYEADRTLETYGIEAPDALKNQTLWRRALAGLKAGANPTGGWAYQVHNVGAYGSMTAAGISSMIICLDRLGEGGVDIVNGKVNCCGSPLSDPDLENAMRWMNRNFNRAQVPGAGRGRATYYYYYMYSLERVGRLTAQRFFGQSDWYREGTQIMVDHQLANGVFEVPLTRNGQGMIDVAMALLFLAKGRRPVLMAQMKYGTQPADWNNRPTAFSQLARHVEARWKKTLTWQVYDSKGLTVDDYRQAPVLFISGRAALDFNDQTIDELTKFVNEGGTLFIERACDDEETGFEASLQAVLAKMFPTQTLRPLEPTHPVFAQDDPPEPKIYMGLDENQGGNRMHLYGLRSGCREAVFYCDMDLSCYWDLARRGTRGDLPDDVGQRVEDALKVGHNVLAYATGKELKFKYEIPSRIDDNRLGGFAERVAIDIAKLKHDGDWNAAPNALLSLQRELHKDTGIPIPLDESQISLEDEELFHHPILFFHGRNGFSFNEQERENLKEYVRRGGYIFGDSVCASEAFAESFRREMGIIFNEPFDKIPTDHDLFTETYGGFDLESVTRLEPPGQGGVRGQPIRRRVPPDFEGVYTDERYAVIFSRYDLSCALESAQAAPDCRSYLRADAAKLAINIVLYALHE